MYFFFFTEIDLCSKEVVLSIDTQLNNEYNLNVVDKPKQTNNK